MIRGLQRVIATVASVELNFLDPSTWKPPPSSLGLRGESVVNHLGKAFQWLHPLWRGLKRMRATIG